MGYVKMELEKQIFNDCYRFLEKNIEVKTDPAYWSGVVEQATAIEKKYNRCELVKKVLLACTQRLCEICDTQEEG